MKPTMEVVLPTDDATTAVAFGTVALGFCLGVLLHIGSARRITLTVAVALVSVVGLLPWRRTDTLQPGDALIPGLILPQNTAALTFVVTALAMLLQIAEIVVVAGSLRLAGDALTLVFIGPVLIVMSAVWVPVGV